MSLYCIFRLLSDCKIQVFQFIKDVRKNRGLWNFPFERADDITEILKIQLSNLFSSALTARQKITASGENELYSKVSSKALQYLMEKTDTYEIKFFLQSACDEIAKYASLKTDYKYSIIIKSTLRITTFKDYMAWLQLKLGQLKTIFDSINTLIKEALVVFIAPSGTPSDLNGLFYTAQTYGRLYSALLEWSIEVRSLIIDDAYISSRNSLSQISSDAILKLEFFPLITLRQIQSKIDTPNINGSINLSLNLSIDPQVAEMNNKTLEELQQLRMSGKLF